jgi:hypothetical protein
VKAETNRLRKRFDQYIYLWNVEWINMVAPVTDVRVLTSVSDMTADSGRARIVEHSRQASCHAKQGFSQQ